MTQKALSVIDFVDLRFVLCTQVRSAYELSGSSGEAYPGFCSMKQLEVFLLLLGWDASPSQGSPPALNSPVPICTPGWREAL